MLIFTHFLLTFSDVDSRFFLGAFCEFHSWDCRHSRKPKQIWRHIQERTREAVSVWRHFLLSSISIYPDVTSHVRFHRSPSWRCLWRHISTLLTVAVTSVVMSCYPGWRSTRSCVVVTEFCLQKKAAIFLDSVSHNNIVACSSEQTAFTCSSSLHSKSCSSETKSLPRVNGT